MGKKTLFILMVVAVAVTSVWANGGSESSDTGPVVTGDFDWRTFEGESIKIMANKHPWVDIGSTWSATAS